MRGLIQQDVSTVCQWSVVTNPLIRHRTMSIEGRIKGEIVVMAAPDATSGVGGQNKRNRNLCLCTQLSPQIGTISSSSSSSIFVP